ncbi:MAG: HAMP domain-containing histidine kinase [Alphaproteobacteria bacterium]|nr:MAG: HAMP domain-containing histidine kinase [Alphaproteobacteria bacterium]
MQSIDKAVAFAQSVLDYGRQNATPPRPVPVDLHLLLDEAAFDAGVIGHPSIRFVNQVPDAVSIKVDPDQFARIFVNLLKNAREAFEAKPDIVEPTLAAAFAESSEGLTLSITDNGPGLPPRARENLFVAFEGSARAGGTGLGLAIARELTEAHGGRLTYVPLDQGTRFEVTLPASMRVA